MIERLALGTAQFGSRYGVANRSGEVSSSELASILETARAAGVEMCDTAAAYGESESRLGAAGVDGWRIVTKLPPLPPSVANVEQWVHDSVNQSLARLRQASLWGVLLHRADDFAGAHGSTIHRTLQALRARGVIRKIGVSVYSPAQLDALWGRFHFDLVQAPLNVVDQRLVTSGWLARLQAAGTEVHARSAFLQGLLLMAPGDRPAYFARWTPLFDRWQAWLARAQVNAVKACLDFVLSHRGVSHAVAGVDTCAQLQGILAAAGTPPIEPLAAGFASEDVDLIEPFRWTLR
jgi:aryl-alcohol dehydrogenase-like predicted oxidoreductase